MAFLESSFPPVGFSEDSVVGGVTEGTGVLVSDPDLVAGGAVGPTSVVELLIVGLSVVGGAS